MGRERSLRMYLEMVGINPIEKKITPNKWCHQGIWPPQAERYKLHLK